MVLHIYLKAGFCKMITVEVYTSEDEPHISEH